MLENVLEKDNVQGYESSDDTLLSYLSNYFGLKNKPNNKEPFANAIDSSIYFAALYGLLDGISVVYSTIKFTCEVISPTKKEYNDNLNHVLSDPDFWLPLVVFTTLSAATFSLIGSYASPKKKQMERCSDPQKKPIDLSDNEKFCKTWLPYARDILKGAKNGYKGIKTLVMVLVNHHFLAFENVRIVALPIGLAFSVAAIFNRCYIRVVDDEQKTLSKQFDKIAKELKKTHAIQLEIQDKYTDLLETETRLAFIQNQLKRKHSPTEVSNRNAPQNEQKTYGEKEKELIALRLRQNNEVQRLQNKLQQLGIDKHLDSSTAKLFADTNTFLTENEFSYLIRKGIGGLIDAPYLYLGVMSLATLGFTAFIVTSTLLTCFVAVCIAVRIHEGLCSLNELRQKTLLAKLEQATAAFNAKQSHILAMEISHFKAINLAKGEKFLSPKLLLDLHVNDRLKEGTPTCQAITKDLLALRALYNRVNLICDELQNATEPTYQAAILHGMQDGLSAFGVLASAYFLLGIPLLLMGIAFPPALIVSGVIFGLTAIIAGAALRAVQVKPIIAERAKHYDDWKPYIAREIGMAERPDKLESLLLNPIDINTDYLTKGEFFMQGVFEMARSFLNSTYKAENLTDFFLGHLDGNHSTLITAFWAITAIIYCAVLSFRAYGKTANDKPVNFSETSKVDIDTTNAKTPYPKSMPPPPKKGIACVFFKHSPPRVATIAERLTMNSAPVRSL